MSIAILESTLIGADFIDASSFGALQTNLQQPMRYGTRAWGDAGACFIFVQFNCLTAGTVLTQGQFMGYDHQFQAQLLTTADEGALSAYVGTFYCLGSYGGPSPNNFSVTYTTTGKYGIWLQVAGVSLGSFKSTAVTANVAITTTVAGQLDAITTPTTGSHTVSGVSLLPVSYTPTVNTVSGSFVLSALSSAAGLAPGQYITGTGIPANSWIVDVNGPLVTFTNAAGTAASANGTGITATISTNTFPVTTSNATGQTLILTGVPRPLGQVYPNQAISGTGIGSSAIISSITGNPGNQVLNVSVASTASATVIATVSGYLECLLNFPIITVTN